MIAGGYWLYSEHEASGSLTGKTYYEACWELKNKTKGFAAPTPATPYQAGQWKQCELVIRRTMFANGYLFAGMPKDDNDRDGFQLRRACPDAYSQVPMGGLFYMYVDDMEAQGGVTGIDGVLPASFTLSQWLRKRWPQCSTERERQGYPKIVEKGDEKFDWEKPCAKCKPN